MFVVTVEFTVKPEAVEDFRKAVRQQAKNSLQHEEGCRRFDVCFDDERPERVFLYEVYDDRAAFDRHCATDYFAKFREASAPMLADRSLRTWSLQPPA